MPNGPGTLQGTLTIETQAGKLLIPAHLVKTPPYRWTNADHEFAYAINDLSPEEYADHIPVDQAARGNLIDFLTKLKDSRRIATLRERSVRFKRGL